MKSWNKREQLYNMRLRKKYIWKENHHRRNIPQVDGVGFAILAVYRSRSAGHLWIKGAHRKPRTILVGGNLPYLENNQYLGSNFKCFHMIRMNLQ